jgi:AcrR family transcriptional regulator
MGRWQPGSRERLEAAALALFSERGYDSTTVAEIAARAGLNERTFYRYFTDKREVLFDGGHFLEGFLTRSVAESPASAGPLDAIIAALEQAATEVFADRLAIARQRQSVINANPELQERERSKMASIATALARTLRERGVGDPAASLAAETGLTVFRISFALWVAHENTRSLTELIKQTMTDLRTITAGP